MRAIGSLAVSIVVALSLVNVANSNAESSADWAWPGMEFLVNKGNYGWGSCSVGYPAWDASGNRYFITAGHCFRTESGSHFEDDEGRSLNIYSPGDRNRRVGFERLHTVPGDTYDDLSLVQMFDGEKLSGYGWERIPNKPVAASVGDRVCLVGQKHSKPNCGKVTQVSLQIAMKGYPWPSRVTRANYCGHAGDSGGAVYNSTGALGINIAGDTEHNEPGTPGDCSSDFVPISVALRIFRKAIPSLTI